MIWQVYGLIDPRDKAIFYVGCSGVGAAHRLNAHSTDPASSAWVQCRDIINVGLEVDFCLFGEFPEKKLARILEGRLILALPTICNKKGYHALPGSQAHPNWQDLRIQFKSGVSVA